MQAQLEAVRRALLVMRDPEIVHFQPDYGAAVVAKKDTVSHNVMLHILCLTDNKAVTARCATWRMCCVLLRALALGSAWAVCAGATC